MRLPPAESGPKCAGPRLRITTGPVYLSIFDATTDFRLTRANLCSGLEHQLNLSVRSRPQGFYWLPSVERPIWVTEQSLEFLLGE